MSQLSRRSVIKAGVAGGGLLWAAPAIHTTAARAAGSAPPTQFGGVQGQVTNANNGNGIVGALVLLDSGESDVTDANGFYSIPSAPAGSHGITASATGYSSQNSSVNIPGGGVAVENFALVLAGTNAVSVVLSWGANPDDLDLQMTGPDGDGGRFHVFWQVPHPTDFADLDVDDTNGNGPETDSISISTSHGGVYIPGDYHIWVHNYAHEFHPTPPNNVGQNFSGSGAKVVINGPGGQLAQHFVSAASGNPDDNIWRVADFTLDAAGNVTLGTVHQQFLVGTYNSEF